jgi:DNA polymerase-3 subunit delta'
LQYSFGDQASKALKRLKLAMFSDFPEQTRVTQLLQRSLERHRLAHAYLFTGNDLTELEDMARTLAKTLNCLSPPRRTADGLPLDCCDRCDSCRRIDQANHPDVLVLRPESKSRIITIDQVRELMHAINLKPSSASYKVGVIIAAERLNVHAANAFLKTLEEPPPRSILILVTTEPQRILETILSRCLRLTFGGERIEFGAAQVAWLKDFSSMVAAGTGGLLGRYRLLGLLLKRLAEQRGEIEEKLEAVSPLEHYDNLEPRMREKLEDELAAAIEAEYRRLRTDLIGLLHWWLRDVWLQTLALDGEMVSFSSLAPAAQAVAKRISSAEAIFNLQVVDQLQRQLHTNVQEALALEVGLLKLKL